LFVAQTRLPSPGGTTPLSVFRRFTVQRCTGRHFANTGFAVSWAQDRVNEVLTWRGVVEEALRMGTRPAANQDLRLQNPDLLQIIKDN
jgi:hypothetical protein